ncbi:MAG: hypothetical protein ACI8VR_002549, partial [Candidatus Azotimanducaceae bacterium]
MFYARRRVQRANYTYIGFIRNPYAEQ